MWGHQTELLLVFFAKNMENNPDLKEYIDAVSKRMAYDKKRSTVNVAVLMQLQEDVARIIEMVRIAEGALHEIDAIGDIYEEDLSGVNAADMWRKAARARMEIANLALHGSVSRWGDSEGLSKSKTQHEDDDDGN